MANWGPIAATFTFCEVELEEFLLHRSDAEFELVRSQPAYLPCVS